MELKSGSLLQSGKYRIIKSIGRGGFGITYLAEHELAERKVCIKEFFPKDYYQRDSDTNTLTLTSNGFAESMNRFKAKFIKEAQTIANLDHANIIHIHDVFEENDTAYYVMEYIDGELLSAVIKRRGALDEAAAVGYIRQVADALSYIHEQRIMHLDVKPGNVMLRSRDDRAILIDFGLSKYYNAESGEATSSSLVGVSHGFAPMEQYKSGGVKEFSPATDIYSLGATLYYLVTGLVPPEAADVSDEGLPALPVHLSQGVRTAIERSMADKRKVRPQGIAEFLALLGDNQAVVPVVDEDTFIGVKPSEASENTIIDVGTKSDNTVPNSEPKQQPQPTPDKGQKSKKWFWLLLFIIIAAVVAIFALFGGSSEEKNKHVDITEQMSQDVVVRDSVDNVGQGANIQPQTEDPIDAIMAISAANAKAVDLGLPSGTLWATYNVGAISPEDHGNYYAWGETTTKDSYTEGNSQTYRNRMDDISGDMLYDAATANWGEEWRMPTNAEFEELVDNCYWTRTKLNGVPGYEVKSKKSDNSIFLPTAGCRFYDKTYNDAEGHYWSSTPGNSGIHDAHCILILDDGSCNACGANRCGGLSVRPVTGTKPTYIRKVQPYNEIWYTSLSGERISRNCDFGANIISNERGVITFDDSVTEIGSLSFNNCADLTSISIPGSTKTIGDDAFWNCTNLTYVTIHEGVSTISAQAFFRCYSLRNISIPGSVKSIGSGAFRDCVGLADVIIHEGVTTIEDSAFAYCSNLANITIPNSVKTIGEWAFLGCDNLSEETKNRIRQINPNAL